MQIDLSNIWLDKTLDFFVVFLGIFIAFWLSENSIKNTKKKIYENLKNALRMEFDNNGQLIKEERGNGISFETFKMIISNEIFIDNILKDKKFGECFIADLWNVISELREVKGYNEFKNYMAGVKFTNLGYKNLKKYIKN